MYGGIIKKVVLKDLKCEAGEWKPDATDTGNDQCFVHLVCSYCVSSVLRIEQSLFLIRFRRWQEREAIKSSSALTPLQPAFPPSPSNSHFTGIARLHHLPAHILQLVHFVLRITSEYLAGCTRPCPILGVSLPFLRLCPP